MQDFFEQETGLVLAGDFNDDNCGEITSAVYETATALGTIGDPRAIEPLNAILKTIREQAGHTCTYRYYDKQLSVEEAVVRALVALGDEKADELLITRLVEGLDTYCWAVDRENCPEWRELQALGEPVFETLMELVPVWRSQGGISYSRAVEILAEGTDPRIRAVLEAEFKAATAASGDVYRARDTMDALGKFLKYDTDQLLPYLESEETHTMYKLLIRIGEPGNEAALVAALDKFGTEDMALAYWQCSNEALHDAAFQWLYARDLEVMSLSNYGGCDPCWGEGPDESSD
jgi:hypothetical protein